MSRKPKPALCGIQRYVGQGRAVGAIGGAEVQPPGGWECQLIIAPRDRLGCAPLHLCSYTTYSDRLRATNWPLDLPNGIDSWTGHKSGSGLLAQTPSILHSNWF
jgi:hypothetical protein